MEVNEEANENDDIHTDANSDERNGANIFDCEEDTLSDVNHSDESTGGDLKVLVSKMTMKRFTVVVPERQHSTGVDRTSQEDTRLYRPEQGSPPGGEELHWIQGTPERYVGNK